MHRMGFVFAAIAVGIAGCGRVDFVGESRLNPCAQLAQADPAADTGFHTLELEGETEPTTVYCDMNNLGGGWTRVAAIGPALPCPTGWLASEEVAGCTIDIGECKPGLVTATYPTFGTYSQVRGTLRGIQWFSTDAFGNRDGDVSVDDPYVDGVSITAGDADRYHLWTYAAGLNRDKGSQVCPCDGGQAPPAFVGDHYTCDTGNEGAWERVWYIDQPLWDEDSSIGGCGQQPSPGSFSRQLERAIADVIEVRILSDQCDENIAITELEIYVR